MQGKEIKGDPKYKQLYYASSNNKSGKYTTTRMPEDDYLETSVWRDLRAKVLERDKFKCRQCGAPYNLEVHHIKYPEAWGEERLEDLVTLCDRCHAEIHRGGINK